MVVGGRKDKYGNSAAFSEVMVQTRARSCSEAEEQWRSEIWGKFERDYGPQGMNILDTVWN